MSTIAIVGGHGKVALELAQVLAAQGHGVRSLIRNQHQGADVERTGAVPYWLDLETADAGDLAEAFADADAAVFSAGAGPDGNIDRKRTVDLEGSLKSIEGARQAGVTRFVQVSAMGVDEPLPEDTDPIWRAYVEAKRDADTALRDSGLDWTIVRPGHLTDGVTTALVTVGDRLPRGDIARADVASVLAHVLADESTVGLQFEVVGGETPIPEALASLGRD